MLILLVFVRFNIYLCTMLSTRTKQTVRRKGTKKIPKEIVLQPNRILWEIESNTSTIELMISSYIFVFDSSIKMISPTSKFGRKKNMAHNLFCPFSVSVNWLYDKTYYIAIFINPSKAIPVWFNPITDKPCLWEFVFEFIFWVHHIIVHRCNPMA